MAKKKRKIKSFNGDYYFLSNSFRHSLEVDYLPYFNAECAFQAQKTDDFAVKVKFTDMSAKEGKKLGSRIELRPDWADVRDDAMLTVLRAKFSDPKLRAWLLKTGDAEIEYNNTNGDYYWGVCNGVGRNKLGRMLMQVRKECARND